MEKVNVFSRMFWLFLALGLTTAVFYSCEKDDDGGNGSIGENASKITATNVINGSTQLTTIKACAYWYSGDIESGDFESGEDVIAQAPYKNNGFTLELPATLSAKYLIPIMAAGTQELVDTIVSDKNANVYDLGVLYGFDKEENEIGFLHLEGTNNGGDEYYYTDWMYADRDVTVKGEVKDIYYRDDYGMIEKYDWELKKGWNVVYSSHIDSYDDSTGRKVEIHTYTSQKPSGISYLWKYN